MKASLDRSFHSPNFSPRNGRPIQMIVLHATVGSARSALAWLTNPAARVSAHYVIDKSGRIYQLVPDEYAAWHAGRASWRGETAINELSLGIELENANNGRDPYPPEQMEALLDLVRTKVSEYRIAPEMVTRHLDVAVPRGRKSDPAGFPWADFLRQIFPETQPPAERPPRPDPVRGQQPKLAEALLAEAYRQVGAANQQGWAFARHARAASIGMPLGPSFDFSLSGQSYAAQSFGGDTLMCPTGKWEQITRLSAVRVPEQQALRDALLHAVYAQAGEVYHPDWAFHQYALRTPIGAPLSASFRLTIENQEFVAACYALDVLFSPVGRWREIGRLSELIAGGTRQALARVLQERWCVRTGGPLRPEWVLYQYALRERLGAPLGSSFRISSGGRDYVAEVFARDVIFCEIGNWRAIHRLSSLPS